MAACLSIDARRCCVAVGALVLTSASLFAGDWPQLLGPGRDGAASEETLAERWPADGPPTLWQREVGKGFSGIAVSDGIGVLFHRIGDKERVEAFDAATGKALWSQDFRAHFVPAFVDDNGPRAVPVIHEGKVFCYGAMGGLHALDLKTGKTLWTRETFADFNSGRPWRGEPPEGYFGLGSSPMVEGGKVIVNVGGDEKMAGVVAFDVATGKTAWTATSERASYSSPIAATIDGVRHLIVETRMMCVSLDPANGAVRWSLPFGKRGPTVTAACPTVMGDHLFLTASYGIGGTWVRVGKAEAEEIWNSDEICSSQYTTCVEADGVLYGVHGRQDVGRASLRCFDPKRGKTLWSKDDFGYATLIKADGKLISVTTDGELIVSAIDSNGYRELARAEVLDGTTRALPALSNGRLFVRNESTLKCLDIGKPAKPSK